MQHLDEYGATRRFAGGPQQGGSGPVHVRDELLYGRDAGQASSPSQPTVNASAHLYSGYAALPAPTVSLWGVMAVGHALIALPNKNVTLASWLTSDFEFVALVDRQTSI